MSIKFTCKKEDIVSAIGNVSKAAAVKSTIPALEGILLQVDAGKITLTGYDLEIGITTTVDCTSNDFGEVILGSRMFSEAAKRMPSEYLTYEIDDDLNMKITGGNAEFQISAIGAEEYPAVPDIQQQDPIEIEQAKLRSMINQTIYAASTNDAKPIMTGELFDISGGEVNIVALDSYRLAVRHEKISCQGEKKFIVPAKTLREASALLSEEEDKLCKIYVSPKHVLFEINGYKIFTRLLDGEFHNYKSSIPQKSDTEVNIKTSELSNCLNRVSLLLNDKNKSPVKLCIDNTQIEVSCKTMLGSLNDSIEADVSGQGMTVGFNNKFLLDALKAADTDRVKISLTGPNRAVKITPPEGEHFTFIVMPARLREG